MSYRFQNIKRYKRGAYWPDGKPRYCTRCGAEQQTRRNQAYLVAVLQDTKYKVPVAYCAIHVPEELR
jgi:hypothetical protein